MMHFNGCIIAARHSCNSFVYLKSVLLKRHFVPTRTFINKWKFEMPKPKPKPQPDPNREKEEEEIVLTSVDDPNFSKVLWKELRDPDFKGSYLMLSRELKKLCSEMKAEFDKSNYRIDSKEGRIDMLFTFEKEEDLQNYQVHTDSSFLQGYSSASLKLTQEETAVFSGNICTDVPKDGNVKVAGYANLANVLQFKSFNRVKFYDWSQYTHLVFKIRGDGRTYVIRINIHGDYEEIQYRAYVHPLYTRGGPYWQIARIPISHFYLVSKGKISERQNEVMTLRYIRTLGITAVGFDGPFKLEIDYVGLEYDDWHRDDCPYEGYR